MFPFVVLCLNVYQLEFIEFVVAHFLKVSLESMKKTNNAIKKGTLF